MNHLCIQFHDLCSISHGVIRTWHFGGCGNEGSLTRETNSFSIVNRYCTFVHSVTSFVNISLCEWGTANTIAPISRYEPNSNSTLRAHVHPTFPVFLIQNCGRDSLSSRNMNLILTFRRPSLPVENPYLTIWIYLNVNFLCIVGM